MPIIHDQTPYAHAQSSSCTTSTLSYYEFVNLALSVDDLTEINRLLLGTGLTAQYQFFDYVNQTICRLEEDLTHHRGMAFAKFDELCEANLETHLHPFLTQRRQQQPPRRHANTPYQSPHPREPLPPRYEPGTSQNPIIIIDEEDGYHIPRPTFPCPHDNQRHVRRSNIRCHLCRQHGHIKVMCPRYACSSCHRTAPGHSATGCPYRQTYRI